MAHGYPLKEQKRPLPTPPLKGREQEKEQPLPNPPLKGREQKPLPSGGGLEEAPSSGGGLEEAPFF